MPNWPYERIIFVGDTLPSNSLKFQIYHTLFKLQNKSTFFWPPPHLPSVLHNHIQDNEDCTLTTNFQLNGCLCISSWRSSGFCPSASSSWFFRSSGSPSTSSLRWSSSVSATSAHRRKKTSSREGWNRHSHQVFTARKKRKGIKFKAFELFEQIQQTCTKGGL